MVWIVTILGFLWLAMFLVVLYERDRRQKLEAALRPPVTAGSIAMPFQIESVETAYPEASFSGTPDQIRDALVRGAMAAVTQTFHNDAEVLDRAATDLTWLHGEARPGCTGCPVCGGAGTMARVEEIAARWRSVEMEITKTE